MKSRTFTQPLPAAMFLPASLWATSQQDNDHPVQGSTKVYELRVKPPQENWQNCWSASANSISLSCQSETASPDAIAAMRQFSEALLCSTCAPQGDLKPEGPVQ